MSSLYNKLDAWSRIRLRIYSQDVQVVKKVHQFADLMTSGCSFHNAQANVLQHRSPMVLHCMCLPLLYVAITEG